MDINDIYGRLRGLIMAKPREARSRLTLYVGSAVAAKIREWFDAGHPPLRLKATRPLPEGAFFRFDGAPVIISDIDGEQGMGALEDKETPMAEPQDLTRWEDDGGATPGAVHVKVTCGARAHELWYRFTHYGRANRITTCPICGGPARDEVVAGEES